MPVTLINVFSVPKDKEGEFVKSWQDIKDNITRLEGFISGKVEAQPDQWREGTSRG